jgi:hypothetical protein
MADLGGFAICWSRELARAALRAARERDQNLKPRVRVPGFAILPSIGQVPLSAMLTGPNSATSTLRPARGKYR